MMMYILFVMLPKVDYVPITSLFVCIKFIVSDGLDLYHSSHYRIYEVIVCNGTVWQQMVPLFFDFIGKCLKTIGHKSVFLYGTVCTGKCSPPAAF